MSEEKRLFIKTGYIIAQFAEAKNNSKHKCDIK